MPQQRGSSRDHFDRDTRVFEDVMLSLDASTHRAYEAVTVLVVSTDALVHAFANLVDARAHPDCTCEPIERIVLGYLRMDVARDDE